MKGKQVSPAVVVIAIVVVVAVAGFFVWSGASGPPTPVVDPNNPMPGMGPQTSADMGPSPGAPIPSGQPSTPSPGTGAATPSGGGGR